jgi:hypothetical protein
MVGQIVGMTTATFTLPHSGWAEDEITELSVFLQTHGHGPEVCRRNLGLARHYRLQGWRVLSCRVSRE